MFDVFFDLRLYKPLMLHKKSCMFISKSHAYLIRDLIGDLSIYFHLMTVEPDSVVIHMYGISKHWYWKLWTTNFLQQNMPDSPWLWYSETCL